MKRKTITGKGMVSLVLALSLALPPVSLSGCGKAEEVSYALVLSSSGLSGNKAAAQALNGLQTYAEEKGGIAARYEASGTDEEAREKAMADAASDGADTIICVGTDMETALYEAQNKNKDIHYVCLAGQPRKSAEDEAEIGENTISIVFDASQVGYLAGYVSVMDGRRHLAFLGGRESTDAMSYQTGFINGAHAAASVVGIDPSSIAIDVVFTGSDSLSPVTMQQALDLYDGGAEIILAYGESIVRAAAAAGEVRSRTVISAPSDMRSSSDAIIMGAIYNSAEAVESALASAGSESFEGGTVASYGAAEKSIDLGIDYSKMATFTENDYQALYASLAAGNLTAG